MKHMTRIFVDIEYKPRLTPEQRLISAVLLRGICDALGGKRFSRDKDNNYHECDPIAALRWVCSKDESRFSFTWYGRLIGWNDDFIASIKNKVRVLHGQNFQFSKAKGDQFRHIFES